jgi:hypothetical protein
LTVINGGRKTREPRAGRRRALHHNEQITSCCRENEIGIATSMAVRVMLAPRRTPRGRLVPGTCTVPAHQRLRPYNLQSVQHPWSQAVEPNKQQPVDPRVTPFGDLRRRTFS